MARGTGNMARMDKLNRRVIYLSDEEWADVVKRGKHSKRTASAVVRDALAHEGVVRDVLATAMTGSVTGLPAHTFVPTGRPGPTIEFRPAPKPSAKR